MASSLPLHARPKKRRVSSTRPTTSLSAPAPQHLPPPPALPTPSPNAGAGDMFDSLLSELLSFDASSPLTAGDYDLPLNSSSSSSSSSSPSFLQQLTSSLDDATTARPGQGDTTDTTATFSEEALSDFLFEGDFSLADELLLSAASSSSSSSDTDGRPGSAAGGADAGKASVRGPTCGDGSARAAAGHDMSGSVGGDGGDEEGGEVEGFRLHSLVGAARGDVAV